MPDDMTNGKIALLCDIGEYDLTRLIGDKRSEIDWLVLEGFVEPTEHHPGSSLQLTAKGTAFLTERGVGLNEA